MRTRTTTTTSRLAPSLSVRQTAVRLGVSVSTVRSWDDQGLLHSRRTPGNHRRFSEAEVERFREGREVETLPRRRRRRADPRDLVREARHTLERIQRGAIDVELRDPDPVPPWEARVREAEADVAVAEAARQLKALARSEREEEAVKQRAADAEREEAERRDREAAEAEEAHARWLKEREHLDLHASLRVLDITREWDEIEGDSLRQVREILEQEMTAGWTERQVDDRVDEILGEWVEEEPEEDDPVEDTQTEAGAVVEIAQAVIEARRRSW